MSKRFLSIVVLFLLSLGARAQVFVLNDNIFADRMSEIRASVVDSLTNEPVAYDKQGVHSINSPYSQIIELLGVRGLND